MPKTTVVGLFDSRAAGKTAVHELQTAGFTLDQISLVSSDTMPSDAPDLGPQENIGSGVSGGAGAAVGGVAGLLAGVVALAIPGIGPAIAAGPIAAALMGASVGAAAGGLIGGLTGMGVSAEHAGHYHEAVHRGGVLVTVQTGDRVDEAADILDRNGAVDIEERVALWRRQASVEPALPLTEETSVRAKQKERERSVQSYPEIG